MRVVDADPGSLLNVLFNLLFRL